MSTTPNTSAPAAATAAPTGRRRKVALTLLAGALVAAGVAWGSWYMIHGRWFEETEDAYANGNIVQVTPQSAGTIISIGADDNSLVRSGQTLIEFDASDARVALDQAEANLARTVRQVRGLYTNVSGQEADLAAKKVALDRARADFDRRNGLASSGAIPQEELAHAREALAAAENALAASQQQVATGRALIENTGVSSHPDVKAAASAVRKAYLDFSRTKLVAPVGGYVGQRSAQVGQRVQAGTPLMAVVPLDALWVDANFKETQLAHMRIGQPVELRSDLYGSEVTYHGHIEGLGMGTGSAFSLLPAQNATGNWIKIVQRVPVRIALDPKELAEHPLRVGLSMRVEVDMHDRSGPMLSQAPNTKPAFSTDVYGQQLVDAETRIAQIVQANAGKSLATADHDKAAALAAHTASGKRS
ncbi:HlyD family efflux transporter periplasmic adaptor subunit [Niveibacterium sp. SC-1]|uniref:HlyD family secretion protein n=1 Tax=Niveibacterium sp. SC-1 TaxID=3135646 RepID=UPI00311E1BCF